MPSQSFCRGGARKTTVREPVRLAHFQFLIAFVNGGHLQGQIRGELDRKNLKFFSLAPSALAMSSVSFVREAHENDHSRTSAFGAFSVFECCCEWSSLSSQNPGVDYVVFRPCTCEYPQIFSLGPMALAISSQSFCWGGARKLPFVSQRVWSILNFRKLSFVNGGHL